MVSGYVICVSADDAGLAPERSTSAPSGPEASAAVPSIAPNTVTAGGRSGSPGATTSRLAAISSGEPGAQSCHASTTAAAWATGQATWKLVAVGDGSVLSSRLVTTPKLPAPAPRSAQNRSASRCESQSTTRPSASTTSAATSRSDVSP